MLKRRFEVIIIGAGVIGLSIAFYLKKKGCSSVLVVEREPAWVSGSTARANGGFRQQFSTPLNIRMSQLSLPVFEGFHQEFGTDIAFRQHGYLFVTSTTQGEEALRINFEVQRREGVPVDWLGVDEIARRWPFLETADLRGGAFCPLDGYADAYSLGYGFGEAALGLGTEVRLNSPVVGICRHSDRVTGVQLAQETIEAGAVVNAAGPFAAEIGRLAGLSVPVEPVRRMLVLTEPFDEIPEQTPMIIDLDTGFLMRPESGRVLLGWSDPEEPPGFNTFFDTAFVEAVIERALPRVPILEKAHINPSRGWAGLYEVTPDHHCILGPVSGLDGFFLANGFSGHGMMHAPAAGMILADLILEGRTDLMDVAALRLSRFEEGDLIQETVVL